MPQHARVVPDPKLPGVGVGVDSVRQLCFSDSGGQWVAGA